MSKITDTTTATAVADAIRSNTVDKRQGLQDGFRCAELAIINGFDTGEMYDAHIAGTDVQDRMSRKNFVNRCREWMNYVSHVGLSAAGNVVTGKAFAFVEHWNDENGTNIWGPQNVKLKTACGFGPDANSGTTDTTAEESTEITTEQAVHGDRVAAAMAIVSGMTSEELETFGGTFVAHVRKVRSAITVAA